MTLKEKKKIIDIASSVLEDELSDRYEALFLGLMTNRYSNQKVVDAKLAFDCLWKDTVSNFQKEMKRILDVP